MLCSLRDEAGGAVGFVRCARDRARPQRSSELARGVSRSGGQLVSTPTQRPLGTGMEVGTHSMDGRDISDPYRLAVEGKIKIDS